MNTPTTCNTNDILHPNLMETASIIEYLKQRQLAIPNIEQQSREVLLKIFQSYAVPLHKRASPRNKTGVDCQMDTSDAVSCAAPLKHKRIRYDLTPSTDKLSNDIGNSMALVTNGCKRIKIRNGSTVDNKRVLQDTKVDPTDAHKTKRQKITWP